MTVTTSHSPYDAMSVGSVRDTTVAYQSTPDAWLPAAGRCENPWHLPRRVNGRLRTPTEEQP